MKKIILSTLCLLLLQLISFAQIVVEYNVTEADGPLMGATVYLPELSVGGATGEDGKVQITLDEGTYKTQISFLGYQTIDTVLSVSESNNAFSFILKENTEEVEEIVVNVTRSSRTIKDIPTRIEFIDEDELEEKAMMNSANISVVLRESTGIQMQQSSLSSGNTSIRIQGLDGRYTQLLKDGFPLFGGFSGGLSIMQIPPFDLARFEIIKGSSSTLYGGGAIAGLVNLVSKTPTEKSSFESMYSQTHALGSTVNTFYSKRNKKFGTTLYAAGTLQSLYDPDGDDFSNLPETKSLSVNPKFFYYPSNQSTFWLGINASYDDRVGGDVTGIKDGFTGEHVYFEKNESYRISSQMVYESKVSATQSFQIKNSFSYFDRDLTTRLFSFSGTSLNSFSEVNYSIDRSRSDWIFGANFYSDEFKEVNVAEQRTPSNMVGGLFINNISNLSDRLILESGIRSDYADNWGLFTLPKLSLLWKVSNSFSTRIGGGMGYKAPDMFTEEAARISYLGIIPMDVGALKAEESIGGNFDLNYKTILFKSVGFSINQLFYYTQIQNSLILVNGDENFTFKFENASGISTSFGAETNVKFSYKDFKLFLNYANIDSRIPALNGSMRKPLTPQHNAGAVLMYETKKWRVGYELFYVGEQLLTSGETMNDFFTMGFLTQRHFSWGSLYVNFENFTDQRQAKMTGEVDATIHNNPTFKEIYAPTDGFIFSGGIIWRPFKK